MSRIHSTVYQFMKTFLGVFWCLLFSNFRYFHLGTRHFSHKNKKINYLEFSFGILPFPQYRIDNLPNKVVLYQKKI